METYACMQGAKQARHCYKENVKNLLLLCSMAETGKELGFLPSKKFRQFDNMRGNK